MAMAEADGIVNSYLEGLKIQLQRKSQEQENQLRQAESERAQAQTQLMRDQFAESVKNTDLARKAAQSQFALNIGSHLQEYAQNNEPDKDPTTGQPLVDQNGIGTYSIADLTGNKTQYKAPTREKQVSLAQEAFQKQHDIIAAEEAKKLAIEHQNRIDELGMSNANAQALEQNRLKNQQEISNKEITAANYRSQLERQTQVQLSRINNGLDDGFGNTNPAVATTKDKVLAGELTDADLAGLKYAPAVRGQVLQSGGIIPKQKDIDKIKALQGVAAILPKIVEAIQTQPNIDGKLASPQAYIAGQIQKFTDPQAKEKFGELSGQSPTIAQVVGGEAGQRLTDFKIAMSDAGYLPSITNPKGENIRRVNNLVDKLHSAADEILSSYPPSQRALILKKYGITDIKPIDFLNKQAGQTTPQTQPQSQGIDLNQFVLGGKK